MSGTCQSVDSACSLTQSRECPLLEPRANSQKVTQQAVAFLLLSLLFLLVLLQIRKTNAARPRAQAVVVFLLSACPAGPSVCPPNPPHTRPQPGASCSSKTAGIGRKGGSGSGGGRGGRGASRGLVSQQSRHGLLTGEPSTRWASSPWFCGGVRGGVGAPGSGGRGGSAGGLAGRRRGGGGGEVARSPGSLAQSFHATNSSFSEPGLLSAPSTSTEGGGAFGCLRPSLSRGFEAAQVPWAGRTACQGGGGGLGRGTLHRGMQPGGGSGCGWRWWRWWPRGVVTEGWSRAARSDHWDHWDHEGIGGTRSIGGGSRSWSPRRE